MIGFKSNFVVLVFFRNSYVSEACRKAEKRAVGILF